VQLQQPGLEIAREHLGRTPVLGRPDHRDRQAVDVVLGLAFGAEGVQQLGEIRERQRVLEPAAAGEERRPQQLAAAQAKQLGPLSAIESRTHLAQGLEGRLVAAPLAARTAGHRAQLAALARQQDHDLARLAQLVSSKDQGVRGEWRHVR
jgi:hypothetical protein